MPDERTLDGRSIPIRSEADIVEARVAARTLAAGAGFSGVDLVIIACAVSEVARNIIEYAMAGEVVVSVVRERSRRGLQVVARDRGPGIADLSLALQAGYSTSRGLGLGLSGSRRAMDELTVASTPGSGTQVSMSKWLT